MRKKIVTVGIIYGQWTVLSLDTERRWFALCRCACGTTREVSKATLNNGTSTSCGCVKKKRHGHGHRSKTYGTWAGMKSRCNNPNHQSYERYGGRGILFAPEWNEFESFLADMGEAPEGANLERIDNNKGYSKDNCVWIEHKKNCQNTRSSKRWHLNGQVFNSSRDAANALGVSNSTIIYRCIGAHRNGRFVPPQPGCWAEPVYAITDGDVVVYVRVDTDPRQLDLIGDEDGNNSEARG